MKIVKWLDEYFEEMLLVVLLAVIACVSLLQVVARNLPWFSSLTWAEEFCRFCWIGSVFLSLPYTIRSGGMLRVNVLMELLPLSAREVLDILVDLVVAGAMGLLAVYSVKVVGEMFASGETSPAMAWPMWSIYALMLFGYVLGVFRALQMALRRIRHRAARKGGGA